MQTIYLAGPMAGCTDSEMNDWRENLMKEFPSQFFFLNPTRRDYRYLEGTIDFYEASNVVEPDKNDIDHSDIVIAYCPKPSVGTSMEIFYAWNQGIPVFAVVPEGAPLSPWIVYHSSEVFRTFEELYSRLDFELEIEKTNFLDDLEALPF